LELLDIVFDEALNLWSCCKRYVSKYIIFDRYVAVVSFLQFFASTLRKHIQRKHEHFQIS